MASESSNTDCNSQDEFYYQDDNAENEETQKLVADGCSDEIDIDTLLQQPSISCHQQFTDFSNVFKAFIGSSLIGMPFAIKNAGVALGLVGIVLIAVATDHCCNLIVKCKHLAIKIICKRMVAKGYASDHIRRQELLLGRCLSYGQIGKMTLGRAGTFLVNGSILITQFGFCVGYFIFLGNTARSVIYALLHYQRIGFTNTSSSFPMTTFMPSSIPVFPSKPISVSLPLNETLIMSTKIPAIADQFANVSIPMQNDEASINETLHQANLLKPTPYAKFINGTESSLPTILQNFHSAVMAVRNPFTHSSLQSNMPWTFALLLIVPASLLILIAFIRNLRGLGSLSVLANFSITGAFAATGIYIIVGFHSPHETIRLFNWLKFPVFFGQITGAYEGIGTVIPIEGSMGTNQSRYPCYLHISLCLLSTILGSFGVLGYLRFGNETNQIVTENLEGSVFVIILRCLLFFGVLFTYPLQIYPIIQIVEGFIFGPHSVFRRGFSRCEGPTINGDLEDSSFDEERQVSPVSKIPVWKSNILRAVLVVSTALIAVAFRSQFAYVAALTGSIGSSLLSYILPCIFHIILKKNHVSRLIIAKDVALIVFGIIGGSMGLIVTIMEIVRTFGKHHPIKHL